MGQVTEVGLRFLGLCACFVGGILVFNILTSSGGGPGQAEGFGEGNELALILLVDSSCAWSNSPDLPGAWQSLVDAVREALPDTVNRVATIGVATAPSSKVGWNLLARIGDFDEVNVGQGMPVGALRYVINDFRGPGGSPQVVMVRRSFERRADGSLHRSSEAVAQRHFGIEGIRSAAARLTQEDPT